MINSLICTIFHMKLFISPLFLKNIFTLYRNQGWQLYFLAYLFPLSSGFHCCCWKCRSICSFEGNFSSFFLYWLLTLFSGFCSLTMTCVSLKFYLSLFVVFWTSWIYGLVSFINTGKFSALLSCLCPPCFSPPSGIPVQCILEPSLCPPCLLIYLPYFRSFCLSTLHARWSPFRACPWRIFLASLLKYN